MMGVSRWAALPSYLRRQRRSLFLYLLWVCTLLVVYGLYGLPWGPALYSLLLSTLFGAYHEGAGYLRYAHTWQMLHSVEEVGALELVPPADGVEEQYQHLLMQERSLRRREQEESREAVRTANRYYTRWSHQAKTPLAALRLLLQEEELDRSAMEQELFRAEQYVDMALQYQRLEGESRDLVLEERDLAVLVRQAVKKVAPLFIHKHIRLELQDLEGTVLTDAKWLTFVLEQLLTNAIKYTPTGGQVTIGPWSDQPGILTISDTGVGILPEDLPRVFDWGYTGGNGRLGGRSTGIGLSLCKQALDLLGHGITLTSQVGTGTTVTLDLTRHRLEGD